MSSKEVIMLTLTNLLTQLGKNGHLAMWFYLAMLFLGNAFMGSIMLTSASVNVNYGGVNSVTRIF